MRTSIALATHNGEEFLSEQLQSYLRQTLLPDQLVISDDCSTDSTFEIVQAFAAIAPFEVNVVRNASNLGFVGNFERALSLCKGDLVLLSDQDDVWLEEKIERVVEAARDSSALLVVHDLELVGPTLERSGITMTSRLRHLGRTRRSHIKGCCTAVRRELLDVALPMPTGVGHDNWLHELASQMGRRKFLSEALILYRLHGANTSAWTIRSVPVNGFVTVPISVRPIYLLESFKKLAKPRARERLGRDLQRYRQALANARSRNVQVETISGIVHRLELRDSAVANTTLSRRIPAVWAAWRRNAYPRRRCLPLMLRDALRP